MICNYMLISKYDYALENFKYEKKKKKNNNEIKLNAKDIYWTLNHGIRN